MYVTKATLLAELPPVRDEWVIIKDDQRVKDIIKELTEAYPIFAKDYDCIGGFLEGSTLRETCDNLYDFCNRELDYVEEGEEFQTSALPGGLLTRGFCDCKGYAGFIGGCLGAIGRANRQLIDWQFCFASYIQDQKTPYHVFVIVQTNEGPIWIDPTPGAAEEGMPKHAYVRRPSEPATVGMVSGVNANGELCDMQGTTIGTIPMTGIPEADGIIKAINAVLTPLQKQFPRGTLLGNWLSDIGNPQQALSDIVHAITGYKYTGGDYALGEIFINRVMNTPTKDRWDTPDGIVPIAWLYMTTLFGLPIAVNTDFDSIETGSLETYLQGRPEQRGFVTQAQVERAKVLFDTLGHTTQQTVPQWPPTSYGLLPYVGPIPDARIPGQLFNGTLPNGQVIQNGYPATPSTSGLDVKVPGSPGGTGTGTGPGIGTILAIAAAGLLLWYFWDE